MSTTEMVGKQDTNSEAEEKKPNENSDNKRRSHQEKVRGLGTEVCDYYLDEGTSLDQSQFTLDTVSTVPDTESILIGTTDWHKFFISLCAYTIFFATTALVFCWEEGNHEKKDIQEFFKAQQKFVARNPGVDLDSLNELMAAIDKAKSKGLSIKFQKSSLRLGKEEAAKNPELSITEPFFSNGQTSRWDFTSSLLFVTSIATTIGYGNITPSTEIGKIMCMIFGVIGIPSTVYILLSVVKMLLKGPVNLLESLVVLSIYRSRYFLSLRTIQVIHFTIVAIVVTLIAFLIPAYIFWSLEEWTFLDSFYYCFISLTTVGLGDLVPGADPLTYTVMYRVGIMAYMFFGILMVMLLISVVKRIPCFNFEKILHLEEVRSSSKTSERIRFITRTDEEKPLSHQYRKTHLYGTYPQVFVHNLNTYIQIP